MSDFPYLSSHKIVKSEDAIYGISMVMCDSTMSIIDFDEELTLKILDDIRFYDKFIGQLVVDTIISVQDKEYKLVKKVWDGDNNTVIYWFSK